MFLTKNFIVMDKKQALAQIREQLKYFGHPEIANLSDKELEEGVLCFGEKLVSPMKEATQQFLRMVA